MKFAPFAAALSAALLCGACQQSAVAQSASVELEAAAPATGEEAAAPQTEQAAQAEPPFEDPAQAQALASEAPAQAEAAPSPAAPVEAAPVEAAQAEAPGLLPPGDGLDLTAKLFESLGAGGAENLLVSPESARIALGMAAEGLPEATAASFGALLRAPSTARSPALSVANALWLEASASPLAEFERRLRQDWQAQTETVDFSDSRAAADRINGWVAEKTQGRIAHLIDPPPAATEMILTNVLLFKAKWAQPFDPKETKPQDFHLASGRTTSAPTMLSKEKIAIYGSREGFKTARLPFAERGLTLLLALPPEGQTRPADFDLLRRLAAPPSQQPIAGARIALPKLVLESGAELRDPLARIGFSALLSTPLSRATKAAPTVDRVTQKTRVEWDEEGAEAAAATAVATVRSLNLGEEEPLRFNRPFYFLILQDGASSPLFGGYVADPRSGAAD